MAVGDLGQNVEDLEWYKMGIIYNRYDFNISVHHNAKTFLYFPMVILIYPTIMVKYKIRHFFSEKVLIIFLFLHKNICFGYKTRHSWWVTTAYVFMEKQKQIFILVPLLLDWLQSPVTKYFSHNSVWYFTRIKPKKYHDYKGWSLVTSLYNYDIIFGFILVDY